MSQKSRILIYDIETSPVISYNWGIWDQNAIEVIEDWQILCFAYKWLGDKKTHVISQDDFSSYEKGVNDDKNVVTALRDLFDRADIVIAHNGDSFDQKKSQARMMAHDLAPPSPYKQIDTKKVAKRYAAFTSNKLDTLGDTFGLGRKLQTGGFATWKGCLNGDKKSWKLMKKYNKQDVVLLEKIYLRLLPWMGSHPAINHSGDIEACPKCGIAGKMQSRGYSVTTTNTYRRFQCQSCGGWSRSRTAEKNTKRVLYVN